MATEAHTALIRSAYSSTNDDSLLQQIAEFKAYIGSKEFLGSRKFCFFRDIIKIADTVGGKVARILDHGCGAGECVLIFIALGYSRTIGVDLKDGRDFEPMNRLVRLGWGLDKCFVVYDGCQLPFADASFDLAYSVTVLEHVSDDCVDAYYREGRRVLRSGGLRFDSFPHRITPYDTHTRLWFVHYFPRFLRYPLYAVFGKDSKYCLSYLNFRFREFHFRKMRALYADFNDLSFERLMRFDPKQYYKGPKRLRLLANSLFKSPRVPSWIKSGIALFAELSTLAKA